ncbi:PEP/pyruvate-binding domain-containing protein [Candidatus Methanodesulfokora washburnensis]|nr:PEP/pyruvate-binding domain-containing protein [Candidatus Methanodesulfokores washburnensis]
MMFIRFLNEIKEPRVSELGGKGYSLTILMKNGFNVPKGFIVTSQAFFRFLEGNKLTEKIEKLSSEINEGNFQEKSREIRDFIVNGEIPRDISLEVESSLRKLNAKFVSVRSSAVGEDSLKSSFAGLHDTFLNVRAEASPVLESIKKCWASLFNERAVIYRIRKRLPHLEGMAVIVQEMIPAEIAGVTFTAHPDTGDRKLMIIEATWGLGESLVSGSITPDLYILNKENLEIVKKALGRKKILIVPSESGVIKKEAQKEEMEEFCLSDKDLKEVALICLNVEKVFKFPQDIEWCIMKNKIWILQSRSITSLEVRT